ncbi:hypothetical protein [Flavobacterium sp. '19STA2R22 D10 B1']|uniref:hypothetical protein n=1 Tax=Flavobacterium aerium TaxID=3037261 RepID=UPI00278C5D14|nr:hypothetical protein [Flavobacterium sp. '19STA2R22 D10 B1']
MLINKFKVLFFVLLLITISCKKELSNNEKFIQNLSNDVNFELPIVNESLMIFIMKKDVIYITSLRQLYSIKNKRYKKFKDFDSFLIDAINNDLLSKEELEKNSIDSFKLNKIIMNEFKQKGIVYLKDSYCESSNTIRKYYLKKDLELNIKQSIMYLFFKNNYYVMQNDYSGNNVLIDKN